MEKDECAQKKNGWIPKEHPQRWRFISAIAMFALAFVGVVLTAVDEKRSWDYWRILSCLFAAIGLFLSFYSKKHRTKPPVVTFWHEILHWIGLVFCMGLLSNMVSLGLITPFAASLQALNLLALATFLAGIYIEKTFMFIGAFLGCFSLILSYVSLYSYLIFIPVFVVFLLSFYWFIRKKSQVRGDQK